LPDAVALGLVNTSRLGGLARSRSLSPERTKGIVRKAARTRWRKHRSGVLPLAEVKRQVVTALRDRAARAFLFGSYARRQATPRSDVDLLVILTSPAAPTTDWFAETAVLRRRLDFDKPVDLIVMDQRSFDGRKDVEGSIQHEVAREGVRLV
jgi:predicted nucleotidyltransferase